MAGKSGIVECAFVKSDVTETPYFATPLLLGKNGLEQNMGMGEISEFEKKKLQEVCAHSTCWKAMNHVMFPTKLFWLGNSTTTL